MLYAWIFEVEHSATGEAISLIRGLSLGRVVINNNAGIINTRIVVFGGGGGH